MSRGLVEHQKILWLEIHIDIRYSRIANMGQFATNGKAPQARLLPSSLLCLQNTQLSWPLEAHARELDVAARVGGEERGGADREADGFPPYRRGGRASGRRRGRG
jgi:hypothetical protein